MSVASFCLFMLCAVFVGAGKICKVPNGGAGACVPISRCRPLYELDNKSFLEDDEEIMLRQSLCGSANSPIVKVCCPPQTEWSHFKPRPIILPTSAPDVRPSNPKPAILTRPNTEIVDRIDGHKTWETGDKQDYRIWRGGCGIEASSGNKIFGGEAANIDQFPWLVLLQYYQEALDCGGSLISSRFILTASHCIDTINGPPLFARLGEYNTTSYPTDYVDTDGGGVETVTVTVISIERVIMHPEFNRVTSHNDIGLVKLSRNAEFTDFVRPICLPTVDYTLQFNSKTNFSMAGWGLVDAKSLNHSDVKSYVMLPFVDEQVCIREFPKATGQNIICAGGEDNKDSCRGDSGGPLMYENDNKYIAVGVLSFGYRVCGAKGKPAVYISVYKYIDWINKVMDGV